VYLGVAVYLFFKPLLTLHWLIIEVFDHLCIVWRIGICDSREHDLDNIMKYKNGYTRMKTVRRLETFTVCLVD
jgi:hypothetical protein